MSIFIDETLCRLLLRKISIIEEIVDSLKILYEATLVCQKADFTLTDFYKCWVIIKMKIHSRINLPSKTKLDALLLKSINKREPKLIDNKLMKCAMILDPRFCDELNAEQMIETKNMLASVWEAIKHFRKSNENDDSVVVVSQTSNDIFKQYMLNKNKNRRTIVQDTTTNAELMVAISCFIEKESLEGAFDGEFQPLKYWETKKNVYPVLYELAMVIFAISPTQVTVERLFSAFAFLFNHHRVSLSQQLLEDILIICSNPDLLREVNEDDLNHLLLTKEDP